MFIDTEHNNEQAKAEYEAFRSLVRPGGLILFDDIHARSMGRFWQEVKGEKLELNHLHWTGFGAVAARLDHLAP